MAKKSSKTTRRTRAKKEAASKKKVTAAATNEEAVIIAEGSNEPVVETPKKAPAKKTTNKTSVKKASEQAPEKPIAAEELETLQAIDHMVRPQRYRMLLSAGVLLVVLVAAIVTAFLLQKNDQASQESQMPQASGQTVSDPDKLLESGGSVCTNGNTQTDTQQSVDPSTVGMMLQSVPAQQIQTPQTYSNSTDASTLQGASCF